MKTGAIDPPLNPTLLGTGGHPRELPAAYMIWGPYMIWGQVIYCDSGAGPLGHLRLSEVNRGQVIY